MAVQFIDFLETIHVRHGHRLTLGLLQLVLMPAGQRLHAANLARQRPYQRLIIYTDFAFAMASSTWFLT